MNFLAKWLTIIRSCSVDNTYKMSWAKAITEISLTLDYNNLETDTVEITLYQIAERVISYYWDQTIFFNLVQGSNPVKLPRVVTLVRQFIDLYQEQKGAYQPVKYLRSNVQSVLSKEYERLVVDVVKALKQDVSYRFLSLNGKDVEGVYEYTKGNDSLFIRRDNMLQLRENHMLVFEAINYRWAQILENFNHSPRICKKVKIIDEQSVKRKPLKSFMKYLEFENPDHTCFICNQVIDGTPALDHVIPWSYLYSDDLWNLVYTHSSCNSSKSNVIPSESTIDKLEQRNVRLLELLQSQGIKDKEVAEVELAIEKDFVKKFWIACQG